MLRQMMCTWMLSAMATLLLAISAPAMSSSNVVTRSHSAVSVPRNASPAKGAATRNAQPKPVASHNQTNTVAKIVLPGIDVLSKEEFKSLQGKRIGLLTNPSGVDHLGRPTMERLHRAKGVKLVALFAAEHGLNGKFPSLNTTLLLSMDAARMERATAGRANG